MKKKSIAARLGVAAMALTLITTSLSSGTLARYTSEYEGKATFKIAEWHTFAKLNNTAMADGQAVTESPTVNLFQTAVGYNQTTKHLGDGTKVSDEMLAPGMSGAFKIDIGTAEAVSGGTKKADVGTDYMVYIKPNTTAGHAVMPKNMTMSSTVGTDASTKKDISFVNAEADADYSEDYGTLLAKGSFLPGATASSGQKEINVTWAWPYQSSVTPPTDQGDVISGMTPQEYGDYLDMEAAASDTRNGEFTVYVLFQQQDPTPAAG